MGKGKPSKPVPTPPAHRLARQGVTNPLASRPYRVLLEPPTDPLDSIYLLAQSKSSSAATKITPSSRETLDGGYVVLEFDPAKLHDGKSYELIQDRSSQHNGKPEDNIVMGSLPGLQLFGPYPEKRLQQLIKPVLSDPRPKPPEELDEKHKPDSVLVDDVTDLANVIVEEPNLGTSS